MATKNKDWIVTESGNRINKNRLNLKDTQSIILGGKVILDSDVTIRGDLKPPRKDPTRALEKGEREPNAVQVGRYAHIHSGCTLTPPRDAGSGRYYTMKLGDYVSIGASTQVRAASIASCVWIGEGCTIGNMSIVKECVVVEDGTVVPERAVIPPFSRVAGNPGLVVEELPEVIGEVIRDRLREAYANHSIV